MSEIYQNCLLHEQYKKVCLPGSRCEKFTPQRTRTPKQEKQKVLQESKIQNHGFAFIVIIIPRTFILYLSFVVSKSSCSCARYIKTM